MINTTKKLYILKGKAHNMKVKMYQTNGGKNLILDYILSLPTKEKEEGLTIIKKLTDEGKDALDELDTRQIEGKLWEIKFHRHNRIFYCLVSDENIYLLHACQKQKDKAEKFNINTAKKRLRDI